MKKLIAVLLVGIMVFGLAGCGSNDAPPDITPDHNTQAPVTVEPSDPPAQGNSDGVTQSEDDVLSKIVVEAKPTLDGEVCVFITNTSEAVVDELDVQVNYKDADGKIIDLDEDGHDMILPGYTVVSKMDAPDEYADFEATVDIELGVNPRYKNHSDDVSISSNQGDECIIVEITNNSDISIDEIEYVVVLYKGEDIVSVCYPNDITDVAAGKTVIEKESTYGDEYDKFEVYLNQAHTFGF